ncbi:MAG: hypothetical protein E6K61_12150 [Nitrospirae bacterium]|nr:MAG: hypothetical protein E6K61_12150 [Nitrospirota bacterium]
MIASAALVGEYGREIPMRAGEIIAIGSELLLGGRLDTNSLFLTEQLASVGVEVRFKSVVGDVEADIAAAIRTAPDRPPVAPTAGGHGKHAPAFGRVGTDSHGSPAPPGAHSVRRRGARQSGRISTGILPLMERLPGGGLARRACRSRTHVRGIRWAEVVSRFDCERAARTPASAYVRVA